MAMMEGMKTFGVLLYIPCNFMSISSLCHSFCSVAISEFCCWIFDSNPLTFDSRRTTLASKTSLIST